MMLLNFRNRDEAVPSALIVLSVALLIGALGYMLLVKPPTAEGIANGKIRSIRQIEAEIDKARTSGQEAEAAAAPWLWHGSNDAVTASALALLTHEANGRGLKLGAFRPQKPQRLTELTELPFSVQVSGSYPAALSFAAALDRTGGRLALRSIQFAATDAATSTVTATLNLSAYVPGGAPDASAAPARSSGRAALARETAGEGGARG